MNKIYKAFDSIKISNEVKEKLYKKADERQMKAIGFKVPLYGTLGLVFLGVFISNMTNNNSDSYNPAIQNLYNDNITIMESFNDSIFYEGNIYSLVLDYDISNISYKEKIGVVNQVDLEEPLTNNFDAYYHGGLSIYTSENQEILILKSDVETYIYQR